MHQPLAAHHCRPAGCSMWTEWRSGLRGRSPKRFAPPQWPLQSTPRVRLEACVASSKLSACAALHPQRINLAFRPIISQNRALCAGGSAAQADLIFSLIRRLSKATGIPVYTFAEDVAASGGYWLMCAVIRGAALHRRCLRRIGCHQRRRLKLLLPPHLLDPPLLCPAGVRGTRPLPLNLPWWAAWASFPPPLAPPRPPPAWA